MKEDFLTEKLAGACLQVTPQRRAILGVVMGLRNHST